MTRGFGSNATFQFYRTERWLGRLQAIYSGEFTPVGTFDDPLDHVLAFFLNCYHIKDWLKAGPEWLDTVDAEVKANAVEQFVAESEALCICADLCNGNKHFHLDRALRSGTPPALKGIHTRFDTSTAAPAKTTRYTLHTKRGDEDAFALATECVERWRMFIRKSTPDSLLELARRNPKFRPKGTRSSA